jgi:5'-3' exonuclease
MLHRLHKDVPADYSACVFDAKGKTFRDDWYPQYKATRAPMPDELGSQVQPLHECIRAMGWPLLEIEGVEADDVIGTLASQANERGIRTLVSSSDKDLTQLVGPHVTMVNTMSNETFDEAGVEAKFGVKPAQIIDYLTLIGDSVDNIPGVDKVGPKTASKLLAQYGTLANLSARANEVPGVRPGRAVAFGVPDHRLGTEKAVMVCEVQALADRDDARKIAVWMNRRAWVIGVSDRLRRTSKSSIIRVSTGSGSLRVTTTTGLTGIRSLFDG